MSRKFPAAAVLACIAFAPGLSAAHWTLQYFYDQLHSQFTIADIVFPSPERGVAVGWIESTNEDKKPKPMSLVTSDGGAHWTQLPLKEAPRSLFFLNDSLGWLVTESGIWQTEESGRTWRKIGDQKKPSPKLRPPPPGPLIMRVCFLTEQHGFAIGYQQTILETQDGGRTWLPVAEAAKPATNPAITSYTQISFSGQNGFIAGVEVPPSREFVRFPAWIDPAASSRRRVTPNEAILLKTRDGGRTWVSSKQSLVGVVWALRLSGATGLEVSRLPDSAQWPAEVNLFDFYAGATRRVFAQPNRNVTDAIPFSGSRAILAAIEPPGRLSSLPIPGKIKMLETSDYAQWNEMDVDYRAVANEVTLAGPDPDHVWAATDTGMILKLIR
jgi:photosystem II stability/assembly factor-like uncharacterized protein